MELGAGWHQWYCTEDFIMKALAQLNSYGVLPEHIKITTPSPGFKGLNNDCYSVFYWLPKENK